MHVIEGSPATGIAPIGVPEAVSHGVAWLPLPHDLEGQQKGRPEELEQICRSNNHMHDAQHAPQEMEVPQDMPEWEMEQDLQLEEEIEHEDAKAQAITDFFLPQQPEEEERPKRGVKPQKTMFNYFAKSKPRVGQCNGRGCKTCPYLRGARPSFCSSVTKRTYDVQAPERLTCASKNIVYLTWCKRCGLQYVGETGGRLNVRMQKNRRDGRSFKLTGGVHRGSCYRMIEHFYGPGPCSMADYRCQPIEKIDDHLNEDERREKRRERETFWIMELRTVYPYGMNMRAHISRVTGRNHTIDSTFNPIRQRTKKRRRGKRRRAVPFDAKEFLDKHDNEYGKPLWMHKLRVDINCLRRPKQRELARKIDEVLFGQYSHHMLMCCRDLLESRLVPGKPEKAKRKVPQVLCHVEFRNPIIALLRLGKIFRDAASTLPGHLATDTPTISHKYTQPIRKHILNYRQTVQSIQTQHITHPIVCTPCDCMSHHRSSSNPAIGHVMTGDLSMVRNDRLRGILRKGPKYRETKPYDWDQAREAVDAALGPLIATWAKKEEEDLKVWEAWENTVRSRVEKRMEYLQQRQWPVHKSVFDDPGARAELAALHNRFVLVPADKAEGNVIIVCKQFYKYCLIKELLGTQQPERVQDAPVPPPVPVPDTAEEKQEEERTYVMDPRDEKEVIKVIMDKMSSDPVLSRLQVPEELEHLAAMYWTAKMHKTPPSQRFIAASNRCVTKVLSHTLSKILKAILKQHRRICRRHFYNTGVNHMWVVDNSGPIHERITLINATQSARSVGTYDFSTLYTNIPHADLKEQMRRVVKQAFEDAPKGYRLSVYKKYAAFRKTSKPGILRLTASEVITMVDFLVDNIYVKMGDRVFRQVLGIPMGTDCAPFLANLYLYARESAWLSEKERQANDAKTRARELWQIARKAQKAGSERASAAERDAKAATEMAKEQWRVIGCFTQCFRYIDDLCTFNNERHMQRVYPEIYPKELILKTENKHDKRATFLDMDLTIRNDCINVALYDKRDAFGFEVNMYPHLPSNVHFSRTHGIIIGQLIRISIACTQGAEFFSRVQHIMHRLKRQGFAERILQRKCHKFFQGYGYLTRRYGLPEEVFVRRCLK